MVYKKYVWKNGRKMGPYYYESYREGDKIKKRYLGLAPRSNHLWGYISLGIILVVLLSFFIFWKEVSPTGRAIFETSSYYTPGDFITGNLKFSLRPGELIPNNSKVIASFGDKSKEFLLSELVSSEPVYGNFYAADTNLSGKGRGFGIAGTQKIYPEIEFEFVIENSDNSETPDITITSPSESENLSDESEISNDTLRTVENSSEPLVEINEPIQDNVEIKEKDSAKTVSISSDNHAVKEEPSEAKENLVSLTGNSIVEGDFIVSAKVSQDKSFSYKLQNGQNARVVAGSVKYNSTTINDGEMVLSLNNDSIVFSTNYSINEKGFGKEFLENKAGLDINIDISKLKINVTKNGNLNIQLVSDGIEIFSAEKLISVKESSSENEAEEILINATIEANLTLVNNETNSSIVSNITNELNRTLNLSLIAQIPSIKMFSNKSYELNLSNYFSEAERYNFLAENITSTFSGLNSEILNLRADADFKGLRQGRIIAYAKNFSLESNMFDILVYSDSIIIATARDKIRLGERVKWTMNVSLDVPSSISFELPKEAKNVSVRKFEGKVTKEANAVVSRITGKIISEDIPAKNLGNKINSLFKKITGFFIGITGRAVEEISNSTHEDNSEESTVKVVLDDNATQYLIEYYTDAPISYETNTSYGKEIVISGPDGLNYTDIVSYTEISEIFSLGNESQIKVYWKENASYIGFNASDRDRNGKLDHVEWITPHLSNQTFWIILVTKAEHLDGNRSFVEDVYGQIYKKDFNFAEIPINHYLRIRFEKNLTFENDITIYANSSSNGSVEVYEKDKNEKIADFGQINDYGKYRVLLNNLNGSQDIFDLRVSGGNVIFDYVVDPVFSSVCNFTSGCLFIRNITGSNKTIFDKLGNVDVAGAIKTGNVSLPDGKDFIIKNSTGSVIAWVDDVTGDMNLAGAITQNNGSYCTPPSNSFIIKDDSGNCVAYISSFGNLWAKGAVSQNAII